MSKSRDRRSKAQKTAGRRGGWPGVGGWVNNERVSQQQILSHAEELSSNVDDEGRALFADDPAVGLGAAATNLIDGRLVSDDVTEQIPVALFEPRRAVMLRNSSTGEVSEAQVMAAIQLGLGPFRFHVVTIENAEGWTLGRRSGGSGLELRDPSRNVFSRTDSAVDPAWVSAAVSQGHALVLYGPKVGVRPPEGYTDATYPDRLRAAEIKESRQAGIVAAGIVRWA